jgi:hypothetical protein
LDLPPPSPQRPRLINRILTILVTQLAVQVVQVAQAVRVVLEAQEVLVELAETEEMEETAAQVVQAEGVEQEVQEVPADLAVLEDGVVLEALEAADLIPLPAPRLLVPLAQLTPDLMATLDLPLLSLSLPSWLLLRPS